MKLYGFTKEETQDLLIGLPGNVTTGYFKIFYSQKKNNYFNFF
jgi:hypothetical protein